MTIDTAERALFVGTASTIIYQFNLIQNIGGKWETVGGDPSHPLSASDSQNDYRGHSSEVKAMSLSFDGTLLVSGDDGGDIFVWDVGSRQVLRKIKGQKGIFSGDNSYRINHVNTDVLET